MRPGCLIGGGLVLLGAVAVVVAMLIVRGGDDHIDLGTAEAYVPGVPVYRSSDGLFVVRLPDGAVVALADIDPHNPPGRSSCRVTFRPDLATSGESGRFFDNCSGATYDIAGRALSGDGLDLRAIPIERDEDGKLRVRR